jgi:predicted transcriptional regulator YdeE
MKVKSLDSIPAGLIGRKFEKENYTKFVAQGEMPQAVIELWQEIWNKDEKLNRKYTADFEVYGENLTTEKNQKLKFTLQQADT